MRKTELVLRCRTNLAADNHCRLQGETMKKKATFTLQVTNTDLVCAIGEEVGKKYQKEGKIPVFSCEGGCIKGEIARLAANIVAKDDHYARACHGELFSVPDSNLAKWIKEAREVVVIDGCSIHCHGRIAEHVVGKDKLVNFDALAIHRKYVNVMEVDDVPEAERKQTARDLASKILANLKKGTPCSTEQTPCGCGSET